MNIRGKPYRTLWESPDASGIEVIDQRHLPHRFVTAALRTPEDVAIAIRDMWVRGAPLIGATAAYGLAFAILRGDDPDAASEKLLATRPTAVNLRWALNIVLTERGDPLDAARQVVADELERCRMIGVHGLKLIESITRRKSASGFAAIDLGGTGFQPVQLRQHRQDAGATQTAASGEAVNILTHCNAGWLACIDYGTATAPIYAAHEAGIPIHVWVDETRPRNQGASLTAYELGEHGVPHTVIADNAGGHLMQRGQVDLVIVGADRVAANGDTANKIGTYLKALAAHDTGVPFHVALPTSTIDWSLADGSGIPIEERDPDEVRFVEGLGPRGVERVRLVPESSPALNPAFDVTPARLITGFITEHGVGLGLSGTCGG